MQIILTHERADFDALASLFGAHLLNEEFIPILPRQLNRNLRAFLTLYGREFPFVEQRDLSRKKVEEVLLVDTQSLITVKGMGKKTRVSVLDHHPLKEDLPEGWDLRIDLTGATATLLTEDLIAAEKHLSALQATLLLIGIYEDTGSLSYASTTPRDIRASAWLLEQGADLNIATDFLNAPLSPAQQEIYDELCANAVAHEINGHQIIIACGDARDSDEEVSSLAHKLRDLLDPDALFILVETSSGTRLVARSSTDDINVGEIAKKMGGGGHPRAAAALIKAKEVLPPKGGVIRGGQASGQLTGTQSQNTSAPCLGILEILKEEIQPSITVAEMMSRGPQILSPEASVEKASELMKKFGYEGYPVVENGRVVGLLNRRAVDRANSHKMDANAGSLMEAGEVTLALDDALATIQRRMRDSGWGQIPVVDEGEVVGIVTRTDLLKTLAPDDERAKNDYAKLLESALPAARLDLIRKVAEVAEDENVALYLVGGFVRDLLLERPSLDFDFVVEGDAIVLAEKMASKFGGRVTKHERFGTAKWFLKGSKLESLSSAALKAEAEKLPFFLDFITARTEFYTSPTALPTVSRGSIKLDLHRRDFTINTLALRLDKPHHGELHDHWGGLADLERGLVRVLHSLSFVDDPTRILRAIRFEQRFGFELGVRTKELMAEAHPLLEKLTGQRIRHELDLILDEPRAVKMYERLSALDLLPAISPHLIPDPKLGARLDAALNTPTPPELGEIPTLAHLPKRRALGYLVWLLPLPIDNLSAVIKRLRFQAALKDALFETRKLCDDLDTLKDAKPSIWTQRLDGIPPLALYAASHCDIDEAIKESIEKYLSTWRNIHPKISGEHLKERELKPGPLYKEIFLQLRDAWLDGEIANEKEEFMLLEELL
ncbi:MAG: CBS domain-containing protein [Anaerolineae bacterium]|jgi:tRNA nucleotidyltransferase (CCA-adding enzyme)|nr:CBS domain-containing protein [Anaerolineae bacterium]MBT7075846.1 CBS domain-containing protein [Anaerolineae bacterium]MBT7782169.1 CBS domain-containing protein [Anaerolineae bacterium]